MPREFPLSMFRLALFYGWFQSHFNEKSAERSINTGLALLLLYKANKASYELGRTDVPLCYSLQLKSNHLKISIVFFYQLCDIDKMGLYTSDYHRS